MKLLLLAPFISILVFVRAPSVQAELATPTAGESNAPLATEEIYCNSVCPSLANSNGQLLNLAGNGLWSTSDDQWCANHNSQTNPNVLPSPAPLNATLPSGSCSVPFYPGDTSCTQVTAQYQHCQFQNSQVESYCQAYESAKMAGAGEQLVLMLDIAATATCATACALEMTSPVSTGAAATAMKACDGAATGAGALEILVTLTQQASAMGKVADAFLGAAGIGIGVKGLVHGGSCSAEHPRDSLFAYLDSLPSIITQAHADGGATVGLDQLENPDVTTTIQEQPLQNVNVPAQKNCKKQACITAAAMAAMSGVRYYNMGYGARTKASSCNNVWNLQSSASAIGGGIAAYGYTSSGGSTGSSSAGSSVNGTSGANGNSTAALSCMAGGGTASSCTNGQVSAATDGGILNGPLGTAAAPLAQQLANAGLPQTLNGSGGLGAGMGGALSGDGDLGKALTKVAETAAENGKQLASIAPLASAGGGAGAAASDAGGFGNLFGQAGAGTTAAPLEVFKGDGTDTDIWHANSDKNLFQIISGRIGKVSHRVENGM